MRPLITRPGGSAWVAVPAFDGCRFQPGPPEQSHSQPERGSDPNVRRDYARAPGGRSPLRSPDASLEPEDAPLHLHGARRHLHHRPAADPAALGRGSRFRAQPRRAWGSVLFVGTKKQSQGAVEEQAKRVKMPYVNHRWLGGLLTNWRTISDRIDRLHELRRLKEEGQLDLLPAKERISMLGELEKLDENLGGVADMKRQPDAVFIVDLRKERLAVREARRLGLPVVALVDTNCDPDEADYVIPGNDDAIRSCDLIVRVIADGVAAGQQKATPADFAPPAEEAVPAEEAEPPVAEGDYEQVAPGEEPVAEEPVAAAAQPERSAE